MRSILGVQVRPESAFKLIRIRKWHKLASRHKNLGQFGISGHSQLSLAVHKKSQTMKCKDTLLVDSSEKGKSCANR